MLIDRLRERIAREIDRDWPGVFWLVVIATLVVYLVFRIGFAIVEQNIVNPDALL